jgi:hypothetical protein
MLLGALQLILTAHWSIDTRAGTILAGADGVV